MFYVPQNPLLDIIMNIRQNPCFLSQNIASDFAQMYSRKNTQHTSVSFGIANNNREQSIQEQGREEKTEKGWPGISDESNILAHVH